MAAAVVGVEVAAAAAAGVGVVVAAAAGISMKRNIRSENENWRTLPITFIPSSK